MIFIWCLSDRQWVILYWYLISLSLILLIIGQLNWQSKIKWLTLYISFSDAFHTSNFKVTTNKQIVYNKYLRVLKPLNDPIKMQFHFGKGPKQPQYVWPHFWKTNHVPSKIDCLDLCLWRWRLRNELNFLELDVLDSTWFWVVRMILCIQELYLFREKKFFVLFNCLWIFLKM